MCVKEEGVKQCAEGEGVKIVCECAEEEGVKQCAELRGGCKTVC